MSDQNLYFWTIIDHHYHYPWWRLAKALDLWFWESTRYKSLSVLQMVCWMDVPWSCYLGVWKNPLQNGESQLAFLFLAFCCLIDGLKVIMCQGLGSNSGDQSCLKALVRVLGWLAVFFDIQVNTYLLRLYSMQDTWLGTVRDIAMV